MTTIQRWALCRVSGAHRLGAMLRVASPAALRAGIAREGLYVTIGLALSAVFTVAATRVITEFLPTGVFGQVSLVLATLTLLQGSLLSPILGAQLRFYPEARDDGHVRGLHLTLLRMLAVTALPAIALTIVLAVAWPIPHDRRALSQLVLIGWAWLAAATAIGSIKNLFNAERLQGPLATISVLESIAKPGLAIALVVALGATALPYIGGQATGVSLVALGAAYWWVRSVGRGVRAGNQKKSSQLDTDVLRRRLWKYAFPLVPIAAIQWIIHLGDRYLLGYFHGTEALGIYAAAYSLTSHPFLMLAGAATLLFRPYLFDAASQHLGADMVHQRQRWLAFTIVIGLLGWVALVVLKRPIGSILLAQEYRAGISIFPVVGAGYMTLAIGSAYENWLLALKRTRAVLGCYLVAMVVSVVLALLLIPAFSVNGAAWATLLGLGAYTATCAFVARNVGATASGTRSGDSNQR